MRARRIWQATLLGVVFVFGGAHLAEAGREANIGGTVLDEEGNKLEGVMVTVYSAEETRTDETNKKGRFRLMVMDATQALRVRLEKEGYQTVEERIEVQVGAALNKTWRMTAAVAAAGELDSNSEAVTAYNAGAAAYNAQDYAAAQNHFESALELDPELLAARKVLTLVYFHLQDWEPAMDSAAILVEAEPDNDAALKIGFDSASQLDRTADAVVFLEGLVALGDHPDTAARVFNQGVSELRAGQRQEAVSRFNQAIEMDPGLTSAYQGLASVYLEDGEYEQALNVATRLLEVDPGNAEALGIRYEAYRRMGDEESMNAALDELQGADPGPDRGCLLSAGNAPVQRRQRAGGGRSLRAGPLGGSPACAGSLPAGTGLLERRRHGRTASSTSRSSSRWRRTIPRFRAPRRCCLISNSESADRRSSGSSDAVADRRSGCVRGMPPPVRGVRSSSRRAVSLQLRRSSHRHRCPAPRRGGRQVLVLWRAS